MTAFRSVTAPGNHAMLRLMFAKGFAVRTILQNYFSPGSHRLYLQFQRDRQQMEVYSEPNWHFELVTGSPGWDRLGWSGFVGGPVTYASATGERADQGFWVVNDDQQAC